MPAQRIAMMPDPASLRDGFKPTGEFVVAARVSGDAASAFAAGPPAGVTAAPDALKASSKPLNVVVIADTDLLADFMWVQTRNFFGQTLLQPFANNGEFVWNARRQSRRQLGPHQHPRPRHLLAPLRSRR